MRQQSYSTTVEGLTPASVWKIWSDIPNRPAWDDDTAWAKTDGPFAVGTTFTFQPKGWPKTVRMKITECTLNQSFTDCTEFFLAKLYGMHHMQQTDQGLKLTTTIKVEGPLAWLWWKIVAQDIVNTLPHQTDQLINLARQI